MVVYYCKNGFKNINYIWRFNMALGDMLTTEEVLLLENLTYFNDIEGSSFVSDDNKNMTVGEWLETVDVDSLKDSHMYGSEMTGADWKETISAIQANDELMNIRIAETHTDNSADGGGGRSVLLINDSTGEAIVAFRGTAEQEWKDNFTGGGATSAEDGVSTAQQENALEWYESIYDEYGLENYDITVTGHSKGGNKAKYITLLSEDEVDRCLSFDGQGFSDEFFERYGDEILARQDLIENHNVDADFVNLLLNDVGDTTFYEAQNIDGVLQYHAPNSFFQVDENGNITMTVNEDGQAYAMEVADDLLNGYLRSMSDGEKAEALNLIGDLVQGYFGKEDKDFFVDLLTDPDNIDTAGYLLGYILEYAEENPEMFDKLKESLEDMGAGDLVGVVDAAEWLIDQEWLWSVAGFVIDHLPDGAIDKIDEFLKSKGIDLTEDQIRDVLKLISNAAEDRYDIDVKDGSDREVSDEPGIIDTIVDAAKDAMNNAIDTITDIANGIVSALGIQAFEVSPKEMDRAVANLREAHALLSSASNKVPENVTGLGPAGHFINKSLDRIKFEIKQESGECNELASCLDNIKNVYVQNESKLAAM